MMKGDGNRKVPVFFIMVKKLLRTFQVREAFQDPYIDKQWIPGDPVDEEELLKSGWKPSDVDRAVGNLLIPHLFPMQKQTTQKQTGDDKVAEEVDNGQSNG